MFPYGWVGLKYVGGGQSKIEVVVRKVCLSEFCLTSYHLLSLLPVHAELVRSHGHVRLLRSSCSRTFNAKVSRLEALHYSDPAGMETVL